MCKPVLHVVGMQLAIATPFVLAIATKSSIPTVKDFLTVQKEQQIPTVANFAIVATNGKIYQMEYIILV